MRITLARFSMLPAPPLRPSMFDISHTQILPPLLLISYSLYLIFSCRMRMHLGSHNIVLEILLILKNVVGKTSDSPPRTLLRNALSLMFLGTCTLSFSQISNRTLQTSQILLPYLTRNGNALPHNKSLRLPFSYFSLLTQWFGL